MTLVYSKDTVLTYNAQAVTGIKTHTYTHARGVHDSTAHGADAMGKKPQLPGSQLQLGGDYHTKATATSPRAVLFADFLSGTTRAITYRPEGTGTGLPEDSFNGWVANYQESAPDSAGYKQWTATIEIDGAVTTDDQA